MKDGEWVAFKIMPKPDGEDGLEALLFFDGDGEKVLRDVRLSGDLVRRKCYEFLRGLIEVRFKDMGGHAQVARELDRRLEAAVSTVVGELHSEIRKMASEMMADRVRQAVNAVPIVVRVSIEE